MEKRRHRKRYEHGGDARYLTFSCFRRLPLFGHDRIKDAFAEHLEVRRQRDGFRLIAWVIMPEHAHLLLVPAPTQELPPVLRGLKEPFARMTLRVWRELNAPILARLVDSRGLTRFWQRGGGYDRNIVSEHELLEKTAYIHQNPVRRGLVGKATDWRWSSARWYAGSRDVPVSVDSLRA